MEEGRSVVVPTRRCVGGVRRLRAALKVETLGWGGVFVYRKRRQRSGMVGNDPLGGPV
jgi:hypothetical protein